MNTKGTQNGVHNIEFAQIEEMQKKVYEDEHRQAVMLSIGFNMLARYTNIRVYKSRKNADGEEYAGGAYFAVFAELPTGKVAFLMNVDDWELFHVQALNKASAKYDFAGNNENLVWERIEDFSKYNWGCIDTEYYFPSNVTISSEASDRYRKNPENANELMCHYAFLDGANWAVSKIRNNLKQQETKINFGIK